MSASGDRRAPVRLQFWTATRRPITCFRSLVGISCQRHKTWAWNGSAAATVIRALSPRERITMFMTFIMLLLLVCIPVLAAGLWLAKRRGRSRGKTLGMTLVLLSLCPAVLLLLFVLFVLFSST